MAKVFVSYSRGSEAVVRTLVEDIQELDHEVWFDQKLTGGQAWWDQILSRIESAEIFVMAVDPGSLASVACQREYGYAAELSVPILPVQISEDVAVRLLPPALSEIQIVNYVNADRSAGLQLARALSTMPARDPAPDPPPMRPDAPISYLGGVAEKIGASDPLTYEAQSALVMDLKRGLRDPMNANDARALVAQFRARRDLFKAIDDELAETLQSTNSAQSNDDQVVVQNPSSAPAAEDEKTLVGGGVDPTTPNNSANDRTTQAEPAKNARDPDAPFKPIRRGQSRKVTSFKKPETVVGPLASEQSAGGVEPGKPARKSDNLKFVRQLVVGFSGIAVGLFGVSAFNLGLVGGLGAGLIVSLFVWSVTLIFRK